MASLFRARRRRSPEDDGDEGEGGDGRSDSGKVSRRRLAPEEEESPAEAVGRSPGWLSGLISGAGRVISAVFFSSPEEGGSSEEEEDEEGDGGGGLGSRENEGVDESDRAIISYSESKQAIEQLLMKETFSRDECDRMIKLIQSRVTESSSAEVREYGTPKEFPNRTTNGCDFTGAWRSLNHNRNFLESVPFSSSRPGNFSRGSPLQASPELCNAAVMEAKKWLEEKRQGSSSKPEDHGPCTLNTDMLNSGFESDISSPVDLAKSYMRSLPPWQSPFSVSQKFNAASSRGVYIHNGDITRGTSDYSLSSSKVMKQDYLSTLLDDLEESRRAGLGSLSSSLDISKFERFSSARLFENDISVVSGTHDKGGESLANNQVFEEAAAAVPPTNGCSSPNANPPEPTPAKPLNADQSTGPDASAKEGKDVVAKSSEPVKQDNGNDLVKESLVVSKEHPDEVAQENIMSPTSVTEDAAMHHGTNVQAATAEPEVHSESHLNFDSELRPKCTGPLIHTSMNGSANKTSRNGLGLSNANSGLESSEHDNPSCTNSSSAVPLGDKENLSEPAADAAGTSSVENGKATNSIEQRLDARQHNNVRRGRKRVVKGRGRGK